MGLTSDDIEFTNRRGWSYIGQGQYDQAIATFDQVLAIDVKNTEALEGKIAALVLLAWLHYNQQQYGRAIDAFDRVLEIDENNADALLAKVEVLNARGGLHHDQQQYDRAIEAFDRVLAIDEDNEYASKWRITSLRMQRLFREAEEAIHEALRRLPDSIIILNERGWLHLVQRQYGQALVVFEQVLSKDENNEDALEGKIEALLRERRFDEAEETIREALNRLPGSARVLNELALLHYDQRQYNEAVKVFDRVLALEPSNEYALEWRIKALRVQWKFDEAEEAVHRALRQLRHDNVFILNERGWLRYAKYQYDEAIATFDQVLAIDEKNENALEGNVATLRGQRRFKEAEEAAQRALDQLGRDNVFILNEHGLVYFDQQQYGRAIETFDRVLALEPDNEDALKWKIRTLRMQWEFDEAEEAAQRALEQLGRDNISILNERGLLLFDQDQFDQADACFIEAIELNPYGIQLYFSRVEVLKRMNRSNEALKMLQTLERSFPHEPEVKEQLGWLYISRNEPMNAIREFQSILDDYDSISGTVGLGAAYFNQGRYEDAEDEFRRVLEVAPYEPIYHTNLAWSLVRQEENGSQLDQAEKHCTEALRLDRHLTEAFGCLGIIAFKRGNLYESEEYLRTSIRVNPREGNYSDLGAIYVQMARYEEAKENLRKALKIDRNNTAAHVELGNLYLHTEEIKEAIREFREAIAIDPNAEDPPRALAIALMRDGNFEEAERVLRKAIKRLDKAKRWRLHLLFCRLLTSLGESAGELDNQAYERQYYKEAMEEVQKAIHLNPTHPDTCFHAGIVEYKLGLYSKAYKNFQSYPEEGENYPEAVRNASLIKEQLSSESKRIERASFWGGVAIGVVSTTLVVVLWVTYFFASKVTDTMLTVMTPILLGLVVVAVSLPGLIRLKLPGLEAELSQPRESISSGPKGESSGSKGEIGFGSSSPKISSGPR